VTATSSGAGGSGGAAGRAPAADQVRNVVLVGHSGTGKSSLIEALLVATGTIQRSGSIEEGTTVSDFDEVEVRQQRSVNLTLAPVVHNGIKVNLLDTPGYADFTGDLRAGLRAADSALFAVSATGGIDGVTRMLWDECAAVGMPARSSSPRSTISGLSSTRPWPPAGKRSGTRSRRCTCRSGPRSAGLIGLLSGKAGQLRRRRARRGHPVSARRGADGGAAR